MTSIPSRGTGRRRHWLAVVALLLLAFGLRVFEIGTQSLWFDEGWSAYVASLPPRGTLAAIAEPGHTHPPGYYLTLGAWVSLVGSSESALRSLSVVQGMLLVVVGGAYTARTFGRRAGVLAVAALAALPALVVYSQETRMYMQLALLCVALAWIYREAARRDAPDWRLWATLLIVQVAALYTHYFAAILVGWLLLVAAAEILSRETGRSRRRKLVRLAAVQVLSAAAYLPWLDVTVRQLTDHTPRAAEPPDLTAYVSATWHFFNSGVLGMAEAEPLFAMASAIAAASFVCVAVVALANMRSRSSLAVLLAHGLVPLAVVYAIGQGRPGVHPRYVLMAAAPLMMSLSAGVAWLTHGGAPAAGAAIGSTGAARSADWRRAGRLALAAVTAASFLVAWFVALRSYHVDERYHRDDVRSVAEIVADDAAPGDFVVLDYDDHAFKYYYDGAAELHLLDLVRDDAAASRLIARTQEGSRVFVVGWSGGQTDYRDSIPALLERSGRYDGRHDEGPFSVDRYVVARAAEPMIPPLSPARASFGPLELTAMFAPEVSPADDALVVATRWTTPVETDDRLKVVVEVDDPFGNRVAHTDTLILDRLGRTTDIWPAGTESTVYSVIPLPVGSPPGDYQVSVGVYEDGSMRDVQVVDEDGQAVGTRLQLAPVSVVAGQDYYTDPYDTLGGLGLRQVDAPVTEQVALEGIATDSDSVSPGQRLGVTLLWRADQPPEIPVDAELRLVVDGRPIALDAPSPTLLAHPPRRWQAGERVLDRRSALVPPEAAGAGSRLELVSGARVIGLAELPVASVPHVYDPPGFEIASGVVFPGVGELVGFSLDTDGGCGLEHAPRSTAESDTGSASRQNGSGLADDGAERQKATLHVSDRETCALIVTHVWRAEGTTPVDLKVFNHLLDRDRRMIAQRDGPPMGGERPTTGWLEGEYVTDRHAMTFADESVVAGPATLEVGLYDADTLTRVATAEGEDRAVLDLMLRIE